MAVNLLHKLPKTYTINGIQYYTRTNQKVNNINDSKELNDVNRINEVNISNKKLIIKSQGWNHTCGDGCCYTLGTDVFINGKKITQGDYDDIDLILSDVLQSLGYEIEIEY
jgi:hypothetical protein